MTVDLKKINRFLWLSFKFWKSDIVIHITIVRINTGNTSTFNVQNLKKKLTFQTRLLIILKWQTTLNTNVLLVDINESF